MMLKRGLSVFLSVVLLTMCFFCVPVFAAEPAFDIADYTIEDLQTMTTAEKQKLMENFIETYNPYGIKELMEQEDSAKGNFGIQPLWKSDSDLVEPDQQMATHQLITLEALSTYIEDFDFFGVDGTTAMFVALLLSAASGLPDLDEKDWGFAGHFYDPDTGYGVNVLYKSAKDNVAQHYSAAYQKLKSNPYMSMTSDEFAKVLEELGRALHYMQDVCEPHHAANLIAGVSTHMTFESYVDNFINDFMPKYVNITNANYSGVRGQTAEEMAHNAAVLGKSQLYLVLRSNPNGDWDTAAKNCLYYAVENSALLIYKLFADCGRI